MNDKPHDVARLAAERIHALINSRPYSPTVQDIEAIIREVTPEFRVVEFGTEAVTKYWRSRPIKWITLSSLKAGEITWVDE